MSRRPLRVCVHAIRGFTSGGRSSGHSIRVPEEIRISQDVMQRSNSCAMCGDEHPGGWRGDNVDVDVCGLGVDPLGFERA